MMERNRLDVRGDMAAAILIERLVRSVYSGTASNGIQPLQWSILRYLPQAKERYRTVARISSYLGVTHAPVIRAANTLANKGFLNQKVYSEDARSKIYTPTAMGLAVLDNDPILKIAQSIYDLKDLERENFRSLIRDITLNYTFNEEVNSEDSVIDRR